MAALGVLGGMGPLASTEFLKTLYEANKRPLEQDMPRVLLDSDPAFPDRTTVIGGPRERELAATIGARLDDLLDRGASRLVLACVTAHHFLPRIDPDVRDHVISLVGTALEEVETRPGRFLLLCTAGTRKAGVFERHPAWDGVAARVALPDPHDQDLVHRMVYHMKRRGAVPEAVPTVDRLRLKYGCSGVIAGCTEFHLISGGLTARLGADGVADPLRAIADDLPRLLDPFALRREEPQHV